MIIAPLSPYLSLTISTAFLFFPYSPNTSKVSGEGDVFIWAQMKIPFSFFLPNTIHENTKKR